MTRDEAIEIEKRKLSKMGFHNGNENVAAANIDALIELGLLNVDEPKAKTIYGKIAAAMYSIKPNEAPADVRLIFNKFGLDIVEYK